MLVNYYNCKSAFEIFIKLVNLKMERIPNVPFIYESRLTATHAV